MTTLEFNALVRQYQGLVYTVCHQLVPDEGDAQDLAQEYGQQQIEQQHLLLSLLTGGILLDCFGVPALLLTGAGALAAGTVILFCSAEPAPPQTC